MPSSKSKPKKVTRREAKGLDMNELKAALPHSSKHMGGCCQSHECPENAAHSHSKPHKKLDIDLLNKAMATSTEHLNSGDYTQAYDTIRRILKLPKSSVPGLTKLDLHNIRFEALKKLADPQVQSLCVEEAQAIVKHDPTHVPAHDFLYSYCCIVDGKIPFRIMHHMYRRDAYDQSDFHLHRHICCNTIMALNWPRHEKNMCLAMVFEACDKIVRIENLSIQTVKWCMKFIRCAMKMVKDPEPIAVSAYAALLLFTPQYDEDEDDEQVGHVNTVENALEIVRSLASTETPPVIFGDVDTQAKNVQIGFFQFTMGYFYETGTHVEQNLPEAEKWYKKAANLHHNKYAAFNLGFLYYEGFETIPKDLLQAKYYWQISAAEGHPQAMGMLAILNIQQLETDVGARLLRTTYGLRVMGNLRDPYTFEHKDWFEWKFKTLQVERLVDALYDLEKELTTKLDATQKMSRKGLTLLQRVEHAEHLGLNMNRAHAIKEKVYKVFQFQQCSYLHPATEVGEDAAKTLSSKPYLLGPLRSYSITNLRYQFAANPARESSSGLVEIKYVTQKYKDFEKKHEAALLGRKLTLDMICDPSMPSCNYQHCSINLTVISEIFVEKLTNRGTFVAEDETGNVVNVLIIEDLTVSRLQDEYELEFGMKFTVVHPYFCYNRLSHNYHRHMVIGGSMNTNQIYFSGKVSDMCRFCGNQAANVLCDKCGYKYCDQNCQMKDAEFLKHEYVCGNV